MSLELFNVSSNMINQDIMFTIMERCNVQDLLFGIGDSSNELRRFARMILSKQKCLLIKDGKETAAFTCENIVFHSAKRRDEIGVHFDLEDANTPYRDKSFNICSVSAKEKLKKIFPNVTKLVIEGEYFKLNMIESLVQIFPNLVDLRIFHICEDMSDIVKSLAKLRHFTHMSSLYSLKHYLNRIPEHLERLDSYGFSEMDVEFNDKLFESYKFVHFQCIPLQFYTLSNCIRQKLAKKIESIIFPISSLDSFDDVHYEEFINLKSIELVFLVDGLNDNSKIFNVLKRLSNIEKLKKLYFAILKGSDNQFLNQSFLTEDMPVLKSITELIIDCPVGNVDMSIVKKMFPYANAIYCHELSDR